MQQLESTETGLAIVEKHDALALNRAPDLVLEEARKAAVALTDVIEKKAKKVQFNGQTYLQFEDWQTLGRFYGVTALCKETKYVEFGEGDDKVTGFEAKAEALLVGTNQVISAAEALCLDDERNWATKPKFQLKSMAQTRACAKVLRNVLAWVVVLAGYSPTPAEEMTGDENNFGIKQPQRKSQAQPIAETTEVLNEMFPPEPPVSPTDVFTPPTKQASRVVVRTCPNCQSTNIQPDGISKQGKPYKAFCRDCKAKV